MTTKRKPSQKRAAAKKRRTPTVKAPFTVFLNGKPAPFLDAEPTPFWLEPMAVLFVIGAAAIGLCVLYVWVTQ